MPVFKSKVATKERFAIRRNKSGNYAGKTVCFEPGGFGGAWWEVRWRKLGSDTFDHKDLAFHLK